MSNTLLTRRSVLKTAASAALAAPLVHRAAAAANPSAVAANIMFDSMGAQVQVQDQTGNRLTTWTNALKKYYVVNYTNFRQPIAPQLQGNGGTSLQDVFIVTTHQYYKVPDGSTPPRIHPNPIPADYNFGYSPSDLGGILDWVEAGGGLLLFVNHTDPDPYWPINDIQLAAALGITTVFAAIPLAYSTMTPNPQAPSQIITNVKQVQALDSGGIVVDGGPNITTSTVLVPLPTSWQDEGPLKYSNADLAFAVLYTVGAGNVIVIGHSGITGNAGTDNPSQGQIGAVDNFSFLMNCVAYLAAGTQKVGAG
ncbi:MAG: hypothetical protein JOZ29_06650 [Deltaproteobacteria bacterium]|nr:hypothetical protein [Deltaproteobacteria bacterium]